MLKTIEQNIGGSGRSQMLERVATPKSGPFEDGSVKEFSDFGDGIQRPHDPERAGMRVPRMKQEKDQGDREHRIELNQEVEAEISLAQQLAPCSGHNTKETEQDDGHENEASDTMIHELRNHDREDGREHQAEDEPVPHQGFVGRSGMVVA